MAESSEEAAAAASGPSEPSRSPGSRRKHKVRFDLRPGAWQAAAKEAATSKACTFLAVLAFRAVELNANMSLVLLGTNTVQPWLILPLAFCPLVVLAAWRSPHPLATLLSPQEWVAPRDFSLLGLARCPRSPALWYTVSWLRGVLVLAIFLVLHRSRCDMEVLKTPACLSEPRTPPCGGDAGLPHWISCRGNVEFYKQCLQEAPWWYQCMRPLIVCDFEYQTSLDIDDGWRKEAPHPFCTWVFAVLYYSLIFSSCFFYFLGVPLALLCLCAVHRCRGGGASEPWSSSPRSSSSSPHDSSGSSSSVTAMAIALGLDGGAARRSVEERVEELCRLRTEQRRGEVHVSCRVYAIVFLVHLDVLTDANMVWNYWHLEHYNLFALSLVVWLLSFCQQVAQGGLWKLWLHAYRSRIEGLYTRDYIVMMRFERSIESLPMLALQWYSGVYFFTGGSYTALSWGLSTFTSTVHGVLGIVRDFDLCVAEACEEAGARGGSYRRGDAGGDTSSSDSSEGDNTDEEDGSTSAESDGRVISARTPHRRRTPGERTARLGISEYWASDASGSLAELVTP